MPGDELEILDANIVLLPEEHLTHIANVLALFEKGELASFIKN